MNLKSIRELKGLTQKEIADIIEVHVSKVSRIENGELEMKLSEFGRLKNALKFNAEYYESLIDDAIKNAKPKRSAKKDK